MGAKAPDFQPGETLPGTKYRIVRQIGAGGMGVVYQVVKPPEIMGVLKLMSSDLTGHEEFRTRFLDEVRVLAQIDHPNIVRVFDYDTLTDKTPFYVMELLHGRTVRDVLSTMGTLPPRVAFEVTRQLCEALHCAHTHDIPVIHRDIKPENIFLHAPRHGEPVVKLIDFGVVAVADREHDGTFVGTWKYAAPEQIRGERATPATDLYAVGLVLYEMLSGIGPFEHLDSGSLVSQAHLREIPPPVSKFAPWVPPSIVQLIAAALAKDPRQRPRDAYAFAERLYELEWASDGKDPNDRSSATAEGPLSRILSTAGAVKPSSKNMVAARPVDRLGNVPVIGVPPEARHDGPTMKGIGGLTGEMTSPGEDALLAGLVARPELRPQSKKARASAPSEQGLAAPGQVAIHAGAGAHSPAPGMAALVMPPPSPYEPTPHAPRVAGRADVRARVEVPTLDAPLSAPPRTPQASDTAGDAFADGTTRKLAATPAPAAVAPPARGGVDTDTFATQESDTKRAARRSSRLALPIALVAVVVIGGVSFAAYRLRSASGGSGASGVNAGMAVPADPRSAIGAPATAAATTAAPAASAGAMTPAVASAAASQAPNGKKTRGAKGGAGAGANAPPSGPATTPATANATATATPAEPAEKKPAAPPATSADPGLIRNL